MDRDNDSKNRKPPPLIGGKPAADRMPKAAQLGLNLDNCELSSGVDWLTATSPDDRQGFAWWAIYNQHKDQFDKPELIERDWKFYGYNGRTLAGMSWGYNERWGYILVARSTSAQSYWMHIVPSCNRVTRLDLQVTVALKKPAESLSVSLYETMAQDHLNKRKYGLIQNSDGGQTLYVGSRQSANYGRVYDKGVEAKTAPPGHIWRYEAEIKRPYGDPAARALYELWKNGADMERTILAYLYDWFGQRGVLPIWPKEGSGFSHSCGVTVRPSGVDRKLHWLRSQVQPTVRELIGLGHTQELLEALGLTEIFKSESEASK